MGSKVVGEEPISFVYEELGVSGSGKGRQKAGDGLSKGEEEEEEFGGEREEKDGRGDGEELAEVEWEDLGAVRGPGEEGRAEGRLCSPGKGAVKKRRLVSDEGEMVEACDGEKGAKKQGRQGGGVGGLQAEERDVMYQVKEKGKVQRDEASAVRAAAVPSNISPLRAVEEEEDEVAWQTLAG